MDSSIFKAYDIRGVYPEQIDEEDVKKIGQATVQILEAKKVVIGHDMRLSAKTLYPVLQKGLIEMGCEVIDIGLCSTPMSYFANSYFDADASLMLTASHNPAEYNGFKLCGKDARPFTIFAPTEEIENLIKSGGIKHSQVKGKIRQEKILDRYIERIIQGIKVDPEKIGEIIVDGGNGIAGLIVPKMLDKLKIKYETLYIELDGSFPNHEPNPLKHETLKDLQKKVIGSEATLGASIDGDGDRIGFVDENGDVVNADLMTIVIAKEILKEHPGAKIMYDLRSSWAVKEEIKKAGGNPEMCVVGHGLIKPTMRKNEVEFAGELSAHYYFKDLSYIDCADRALVFILQMLSSGDEDISEMVAPYKKYFQTGEINFEVENPKAKIKEIEEKVEGGDKFYLDGLSVEFDDWWFNLRPSNTEPLLRLNLEAKSKELMEEKKKYIMELISTKPE